MIKATPLFAAALYLIGIVTCLGSLFLLYLGVKVVSDAQQTTADPIGLFFAFLPAIAAFLAGVFVIGPGQALHYLNQIVEMIRLHRFQSSDPQAR